MLTRQLRTDVYRLHQNQEYTFLHSYVALLTVRSHLISFSDVFLQTGSIEDSMAEIPWPWRSYEIPTLNCTNTMSTRTRQWPRMHSGC